TERWCCSSPWGGMAERRSRLPFPQHFSPRLPPRFSTKSPSACGSPGGQILANLNPISLWRRFLSTPNDNRTKTLAVAFLVSLICAIAVTGATVVLRPIQAQNRAAEQQARLEALVTAVPGIAELIAQSGGDALSTAVIDLEAGSAATEVTPETLEAALSDPANWTALAAGDDTAGIGSRPNYAQIYLIRSGDTVSL